MKKLLCLALATLMLLGMFTGCSGKTTAEPTNAPASDGAASTQTPATELKGELVFTIWDNNLMTYIEENDMVGKF